MELANKWLSTPRKKELDLIKKWRILRGDRVAVISGPELGKQGVVSKVFHKENKLIIEGVNLKRVLGEPGPDGQKPRKEWREMGLHYSQVNLIDPVDGYAIQPYLIEKSALPVDQIVYTHAEAVYVHTFIHNI